jgi:hypothetical protein
MSFKYIQAFGFTNAPSAASLKASYGMHFAKVVTSNLFSDKLTYLLDTNLINEYVTSAIAEGSDMLIFEVTGSHIKYDIRNYQDSEVDATLQAFENIYTTAKARAVASSRPDLMIGFAAFPSFSDDYETITNYISNPSDPLFNENYTAYLAAKNRCNKRLSGGVYVSRPISDFCDFFVPQVYGYKGNGDSATYEWSLFAKNQISFTRDIANGKPIFAMTSMYHSETDIYIGQPVNVSFMNSCLSEMSASADGIILRGGLGVSYQRGRFRYFPSGEKEEDVLGSWRKVDSGAFSVKIHNIEYLIQGINTMGASSMTEVAATLEAALQTQILDPSPKPDPIPFTTGTVTVEWDSGLKSFLFNVTNGDDSSSPPWATRQRFQILVKKPTVDGIDLSDSEYLGDAVTNVKEEPFDQNYAYLNDIDGDEWTSYVLGQEWWESFSQTSTGNTTFYNTPSPVITVLSDAEQVYPYTLYVSANDSTFNGVSKQDCVFEWDFGDNSPPSNVRNYTYFADSRVDGKQDSDGNAIRNTSLSSKQRGISAAYTYWHANGGTPFTITLKIWHNGKVSSTATTTKTVATPIVNDYPTNNFDEWTRVPVIMAEQTPPANTFQTMQDAVTWMDNNKPEGKVIFDIVKSNATDDQTLPLGGTIAINSPNVIIRTLETGGVVVHANSSFSRTEPLPLFVTDNILAKNVHFQNIQFGANATFDFDDDDHAQGSETTSLLRGCDLYESIGPRNTTFTNCTFKNLDQAVLGEFMEQVYFNQCRFHSSNNTIVEMTGGTSVVMNGCIFGDNDKIAVVSNKDWAFTFGFNFITSSLLSIQFCDFEYNAEESDDLDIYGYPKITYGCFKLKNIVDSSIYGCRIAKGTNSLFSSTDIRMDANIFESGANAAAILVSGNTSGLTIASNVFIPGGAPYAGCFSFVDEVAGSASNIKIVNNTTIANANVDTQTAFWNFIPANNISVSSITFVNNLNVENSSYCVSRWIAIDKLNQFSALKANIWPSRRSDMEFAIADGATKTWSQWKSSKETDATQMNVAVTELPSFFRYKLSYPSYLPLFLQATENPASARDYNDSPKNVFASRVVGAAIPIYVAPSLSSSGFTSTTTIKTRTRSAMSSCQNAFVQVVDPDSTTLDSSGSSVTKPLIKQINSTVSDILKFTTTDANLNASRAFRIKYTGDENSAYIAASFGIMTVSSVDTFVARFIDKDNIPHTLAEIAIADYSLVKELVQAIGIALDGVGVTAQVLGTDEVPTSDLRNTESLEDGYNRWGVCYLQENSVTLGNWIHTSISVSTVSTGYDLTIVYTNDGPSVQNQGDIAQRMGSLSFDGLYMGRIFAEVDNTNASTAFERRTILGSYDGTPATYPFQKFSPTHNLFNETHAVGICMQQNFVQDKRLTSVSTTAIGDTGYASNVVFGWYGETQADSLNYVNKDCLAYGESYTVKVSVRFSRNPKSWVTTLSPYKSYFAQTFGAVTYMKDPRPVWPAITAVASNGQPLYYQSSYDPANTNPAVHGWAWWANNIKNNYKNLGYERQFMFSPSGLYWNRNVWNYPFSTLAPLFDTTNSYPQSSAGPYTDSCLTKVGDTCIGGSFTVVPSLLKGSLFLLRDAIQEIPVFGFYQGHASVVSPKWNPAYTDLARIADMSNSTTLQYAKSELDLMSYYIKSNILGLDSYFDGFEDLSQSQAYIALVKSLHPHLKLMVNPSPNDVTSLGSMSFLSSYDSSGPITGPHILAEYITPGSEQVAWVYVTNIANTLGSSVSGPMIKNQMASLASWGYCTGPFLDDNNHPANISTETDLFLAADRRFVYDTKPSEYQLLATPSNIMTSISDALVNATYQMRRQCIAITWRQNTEPDFSHYIVYRARIVNGIADLTKPYHAKAYLKSSSFVDNQVFSEKTYYYKIIAYDVYGNASSPASFSVKYIADDPILNAPTNVSASADISHGRIRIAWN